MRRLGLLLIAIGSAWLTLVGHAYGVPFAETFLGLTILGIGGAMRGAAR